MGQREYFKKKLKQGDPTGSQATVYAQALLVPCVGARLEPIDDVFFTSGFHNSERAAACGLPLVKKMSMVMVMVSNADGSAEEPGDEVLVARYSPGSWFWWCLPLMFAGVAALAYSLGLEGRLAKLPIEQLDAQPEDFDQDRMDELRAELTELRIAQTADSGVNNEVRASFRELQSQIAALEEEVVFYRSLMAPDELAKGLHIEKMLLRSTERPGVYSYELVIAQTVARHAWQSGELYYEVHGAVNGERAVLALTEIATIPEYPLNFKFRYFQNYSGEFDLPSDFTPETVIVTLDRGSEGEIVQKRYDWRMQGE